MSKQKMEEESKKNKKRKRLSTKEVNSKAAKTASVQSKKGQETRVQEIVAAASSSRPTDVFDGGIASVPPPDHPVSAPVTNDAKLFKMF